MLDSKLCFQLVGSQYVLLYPEHVLFLEADRQVCQINLTDGSKLVACRHLGYYKEELIRKFSFWEASKSFLVNPAHITRYTPRERLIHLCSGHSIPVSKSRQEEMNRIFRQMHERWKTEEVQAGVD